MSLLWAEVMWPLYDTCLSRTFESCTVRWRDVRWTNPTLLSRQVLTRSWATSGATGRKWRRGTERRRTATSWSVRWGRITCSGELTGHSVPSTCVSHVCVCVCVLQEAQCVSSRLSPEEEQVEALKAECNDTGCKIQSLQAETESIRALVRRTQINTLIINLINELMNNRSIIVSLQKRGLENSLSDARHWHDMELQNLGSVVAKLEAELADVNGEIEQQRRDYDTLLSNKQRLEQEIGMYHGVLDGEESRFLPANTPWVTGTNDKTSDSWKPTCVKMSLSHIYLFRCLGRVSEPEGAESRTESGPPCSSQWSLRTTWGDWSMKRLCRRTSVTFWVSHCPKHPRSSSVPSTWGSHLSQTSEEFGWIRACPAASPRDNLIGARHAVDLPETHTWTHDQVMVSWAFRPVINSQRIVWHWEPEICVTLWQWSDDITAAVWYFLINKLNSLTFSGVVTFCRQQQKGLFVTVWT